MNREEAMLHELNLYPLWRLREGGKEAAAQPVAAAPAVTPESPTNTQPVVSESASVNGLGWAELKTRVKECTACGLRAGCTQTVFGVGDEKASWLFVGEGPGAEEDAQGEPFVGAAGQLLDKMIAAIQSKHGIQVKRGEDVYIANVVKCRPPSNRAPQAEEVAACMPYLQRQIALIRPKIIVALGKTAANALLRKGDAEGIGSPSAVQIPSSQRLETDLPALRAPLRGLGRDATLGSLRGKVHDYGGIPLIITYHPAYLLRTPEDKGKAWQDLCLAVDTIRAQAA